MKIAFVTFGNFDGHATLKRATGMAGPLAALGHEVHLLLEDASANRAKAVMECPAATVHWHDRASSPLAERRAKQNTINAIQPDLVWICGVGLRNWIRKPKRDTAILADHSELYSVVVEGKIRRCVYSLLEWAYCFGFDGQICASRYLQEFYRSRFQRLGKYPERIHYSPYAYHPEVIRLDPAGAESVKARYPGKKIILYMGTFRTNYGFWDMLHAFERLSKQRDDFVALFAGRGRELDKGLGWIEEKGLSEHIVLEGYVPEESLSAYFGAAHAYLSPLRDTVQDWARCPSKLYMYLPFNKPVITCPIGEARELFGDAGVYYEPGNVKALTSRIEEQLNEESPGAQVDPLEHTYAARTERFLKWFNQAFGER